MREKHTCIAPSWSPLAPTHDSMAMSAARRTAGRSSVTRCWRSVPRAGSDASSKAAASIREGLGESAAAGVFGVVGGWEEVTSGVRLPGGPIDAGVPQVLEGGPMEGGAISRSLSPGVLLDGAGEHPTPLDPGVALSRSGCCTSLRSERDGSACICSKR